MAIPLLALTKIGLFQQTFNHLDKGGMDMKRFMRTVTILAALTLVGGLFLAATVTFAFKGGEVVIGACWDLTGPFAPSGTPIANGERDYVRYVNEELGGINGHKVKLIGVDTSYNMDREIAAYKKFRDVDNVLFMTNVSSGAAMAIEKMQTPFTVGLPHEHGAEPTATFIEGGWYWPSVCMWADGGGAVFKWWLDNRWYPNNKRAPRVSLMHLDALPGRTSAKYFRDQCKQLNISVVQEMYTPFKPTDTMSFVMAMKSAKPDIVIGIQTEICWTVMSKDMRRVGLNLPRLSPYFGPLDPDAIAGMGKPGIGMLSFLPYATYQNEDVQAIQLIKRLAEKWHGGKMPKRHTYYWGWFRMAMKLEAVKRAMDKVGYEGLTSDIQKGRIAVREAMANDMKGFTAMGIVSPMTVSEKDHRPYQKVRAAEIVSGTAGPSMKVVSEWIDVPKLRPEQMNADWWIK
jgi:branched-chain amino acid transport system substrate-binding protein